MITEILTMTIVRDPIQDHPQPHPLEAEEEEEAMNVVVEVTRIGDDTILRRRHPPEITGARIIVEAVEDDQITVVHQTIVAQRTTVVVHQTIVAHQTIEVLVEVHLALAIIPGHLEVDLLLEEDPNHHTLP